MNCFENKAYSTGVIYGPVPGYIIRRRAAVGMLKDVISLEVRYTNPNESIREGTRAPTFLEM